jgi:drug/metabolite transporter (DMT)-like permease
MTRIVRIPKSLQADLALLLITFIWGATFTVVKSSLAQVSPVLFIALRFWIATAVMAGLFLRSHLRFSKTSLRQGLVLAVALFGGFLFQTIGLLHTTPSRSAFITSLSVLLVPLLGYTIFHRRPQFQTLAGIAVATIGLCLLTMNSMDLRLHRGETLTLAGAAAFACHILFVGRFLPGSDYRQLILLQTAGCALLSTLAMPALETPFLAWDITLGCSLCATGVLATAFTIYVQNRAQQFTTANRAALIFSLEPFFAALFAYWLLGDVLTGREWLGGLLVVAGIIVSEIKRDE